MLVLKGLPKSKFKLNFKKFPPRIKLFQGVRLKQTSAALSTENNQLPQNWDKYVYP